MTATDRPTEPPVECVAVDRDERCLCPGGPASHRPSPPAPAAEDDAVEKAARVWHAEDATEPRAWDALSDDERGWYIATTRKSLAAAGVSVLRAEVERAERDWKQASEDADRWCARAEAAEAEVERLREENALFEDDANGQQRTANVYRAERDEARQQVAALRAALDDERAARRIAGEAADRFRDVLADCLGHDDENPGDDVLVAEVRTHFGKTGPEPTRWRDFLTGARARLDQIEAMPDPLRALAGSGEQPGACDGCGRPDDGNCNCPLTYDPAKAVPSRPAPMVPDSTGLRQAVYRALDDTRGWHPSAADQRLIVLNRMTEAVLAAVRSDEQGCNCGFGGQHDPANPRCRVNDPTEAWLRSNEQGGEA